MRRASPLPALLALAVAAAAPAARADDPGPAADVTAPPPFGEFLVLPLRVHLLRSDELPELNCTLGDDDARRIVAKVNGVWHAAGIHWGLESIVREPAAAQGPFRLARDLDPDGRPPLGLYRALRPEASRRLDGLHVYYLHRFAVNGVYLGADYAFVQDTARLRAVEGGLDEPLPRVTAHELGHALGLPHRQDRTNLLASGTTGALLNAREVAAARARARDIPGAATVAEVGAAIDRAACDSPGRARLLLSWLAEVPGADAAALRARRDALPADPEPAPPEADGPAAADPARRPPAAAGTAP